MHSVSPHRAAALNHTRTRDRPPVPPPYHETPFRDPEVRIPVHPQLSQNAPLPGTTRSNLDRYASPSSNANHNPAAYTTSYAPSTTTDYTPGFVPGGAADPPAPSANRAAHSGFSQGMAPALPHFGVPPVLSVPTSPPHIPNGPGGPNGPTGSGGPGGLVVPGRDRRSTYAASSAEGSVGTPLSIGGLEIVGPPAAASEAGSAESAGELSLGRESTSTREGSDVSKEAYHKSLQIIQSIKDRSTAVEDVALIIRRMEITADRSQRRTYVRGAPAREVYENAPVIRVGIVFLPGANRPTVTQLEQDMLMAGYQPDQQSAMWRVNTAGHLLMDFEVTKDLNVIASDLTADFISRARERHERPMSMLLPHGASGDPFMLREQKHPAVNIDSRHVTIVHDLRYHYNEFDLESTLIEVDAASMMKLIVGFRLIVQYKAPSDNLDETRKLLEVMMEDVRRLCQRSAILFRMSTRVKIMNSKNTRYGVNNGRQFTTLTTSKGIREIIKLSASYFTALDTMEKAQQLIRPRFLQMLVLLLSFLNNSDLDKIRYFVEQTFHFKADRSNLELLFLKVIPFYSINPRVFLTSVVAAFESDPPKEPETCDYAWYWDTFLKRLTQHGYLLPGSVDQLGRRPHSWLVKWPKNGFKNSQVFRNLQYGANDGMKTFNEVPPIEEELDRRDESMLLTAVMTNDEKYLIRVADYEAILCLTRGVYAVQEAGLTGRRTDLVIEESVLNEATYNAVERINPVIRQINQWLTGSQQSRGNLRLARQRTNVGRLFGARRPEIAMFDECRVTGKLTRHRAVLASQVSAIAYKLDGRKITLNDAIGNMASDNQQVQGVVEYYQLRLPRYADTMDELTFRRISKALDEVLKQVNHAESVRHQVSSDPMISDEPIVTLLQQIGGTYIGVEAWSPYSMHLKQTGELEMEAKKSYVRSVLWRNSGEGEVILQGDSSVYVVAPLEWVEDEDRDDYVKVEDIVLLAGQYMVVAEPDEDDHSNALLAANFLRV
ncbi:hypothetical protein EJ06DRAFT_530553, partial [Trichodelitschia bisporula]